SLFQFADQRMFNPFFQALILLGNQMTIPVITPNKNNNVADPVIQEPSFLFSTPSMIGSSISFNNNQRCKLNIFCINSAVLVFTSEGSPIICPVYGFTAD